MSRRYRKSGWPVTTHCDLRESGHDDPGVSDAHDQPGSPRNDRAKAEPGWPSKVKTGPKKQAGSPNMTEPNSPHISVCIPTYKRPSMLAKCLDALTTQCAKGFTYSIVVVDNDIEQSASRAVGERAVSSSVDVMYAREDGPNISRARNRAVASARGEYIAFIDDDEVPGSSWLLKLYETCQMFSADGVLGPVLPHYERVPPDWLVKSGLCVRARFPTGTRLNSSKYLRTGNILLQRKLFDGLETPFDPRFGRSGGEDADLLGRMLKAGRSFVWCEEAPVYETVPAERQTLHYHMRRALLRGVTEADKEAFFSLGSVKSIFAIVLYAVALPFLLATRYYLFARYLVKCCDHLAKLLAHLGLRLARERAF